MPIDEVDYTITPYSIPEFYDKVNETITVVNDHEVRIVELETLATQATTTGFSISSTGNLTSTYIAATRAIRRGNQISLSLDLGGTITATGGLSFVANIPIAFKCKTSGVCVGMIMVGAASDFRVYPVGFDYATISVSETTLTIALGSDAGYSASTSVRVTVMLTAEAFE